MDCSDFPAGGPPSRRSELLGPRPAPLKVRKDSHKTKKPPGPAAPQHGAAPLPPLPPPQQIRRPIIIYAVSPKVIHTTPGDFMSVVQRLTGVGGAASSSSASADAEKAPFSPAARLAAFERSTPKSAEYFYRPSAPAREQNLTDDDLMGLDGGASTSSALFPGILSPVPSSLPCIAPNLFSPPAAEQSQISLLLNEVMISPAMHGSRGFMGMDSFMASPSSFFLSSGVVPSPAANYWDLFNKYIG